MARVLDALGVRFDRGRTVPTADATLRGQLRLNPGSPDTLVFYGQDSGGTVVQRTVLTPAVGAANADTSGATLGQLETEVNELKAALRAAGIIAT